MNRSFGNNALCDLSLDTEIVNFDSLVYGPKTPAERKEDLFRMKERRGNLREDGNIQAIPLDKLLETPLTLDFNGGLELPPLEIFDPDDSDFALLYDAKIHGYPRYIRKSLRNKPYLMLINGKILVGESPRYKNTYYPCVGNARGFEFDSYSEPMGSNCLLKLHFLSCGDGIYFMPAIGAIETWATAGLRRIPSR